MQILLLALLPALGSFAGAMIAEWKQPPKWVVGAALHAAAGIATAVVAIELMPRAMQNAETWTLAIAFVVGGFASIALNRASDWARRSFGQADQKAAVGLWAVYGAVAADLLIDGLTTGAGAAVSSGLGLLLAASQVVANLPGGFAVTYQFRQAGAPRRQRFWMAGLYPLTPVIGAFAGYVALRDASTVTMGIALAAFSGLLLLATIEEIIPAADKPNAPRTVSSTAFAAGFVGLMLMSSYFRA